MASPRMKRAPFGREQWLQRNQNRRETEWKRDHTMDLQKISPRLMHQYRCGRLGTADYKQAIHAYKTGGETYSTWADKHIIRRDPCYNPYTGKYENAPTFNVAARRLTPRSLPPIEQQGSPMAGSMGTPRGAAPAAADVPWFMQYEEDAPMDKNNGHTDHALEMWRTGHGIGGGPGTGISAGYQFDGDVAASGAGDNVPITEFELESAHDAIRLKLMDRFSTFRRAFQVIDEDRDGKVTKIEALRILMMLNLTNVREKVMNKLCDIMDKDGDGVEYDEFCAWLNSEDVKHLHTGNTKSVQPSAPPPGMAARPTFARPDPYQKPPTPRRIPTPIRKGLSAPPADWLNSEAEDAPMAEYNFGLVDHSLEMFRTGQAMGGGPGAGYSDGYRFDGDVAASGAGDSKPVTEKELEQAHDLIREKLQTRFISFRRAFEEIDENRSGKVTKIEALRMLMMLNLTNVREKVMNKLCDIMDKDGDGVEYDEFCAWLMANDARDLVMGK